jgi:glycosyltransferase involved in cell wall biosynthesis
MDRKEFSMRLLVVTPSYWPATDLGGPIFSLHNLNKALAKKGFDVTVYTTNARLKGKVTADKETLLDGVKVTYFSFSGAFEFLNPTGWQFSVPMRKALKKNIKDFDLVYILSVWNYPVVMAASICRKFNKPYIISPRGLLYPETFGKKMLRKRIYYNLLAKKFIQKAAAIHYTTHDEAENCHNRLGLKNKALVVPNGIDLSEFSSLPGNDEIRNRHPELKGKKVILFLGRLNWKKGLDILIKAYSRAAQERNDVHLLIAGGDDGYKNTAERLVRDLRLSNRVTFTGPLSGREKLEAYAGSDIFVLSSYSENFGMTVVEAMACGLPIVISDKVGIYKEVQDSSAGIVVKTDAESVYRGLKELLADPGAMQAYGQSGKKLVRELFDAEKVAGSMLSLYEIAARSL